jgi:hypothetical protein
LQLINFYKAILSGFNMPKLKKGTLNQLWWNIVVDEKEKKVNYFFTILNSDSREISTIKNRIFSICGNIDDFDYVYRTGKIAGLYYLIMKAPLFNKGLEFSDLNKIYQGKKIKDERLYDRKKGIDGLEDYVLLEIKKITGQI